MDLESKLNKRERYRQRHRLSDTRYSPQGKFALAGCHPHSNADKTVVPKVLMLE